MRKVLDVTIEIAKNSKIKYEFDRKNNEIRVDRILYGSSSYPQNYGFIKNALDWDGDELDVVLFADQEFQPGVVVPTRIVGAMDMIDGNETDTKLIGVIDCDPRYDHIEDLKDIPNHLLKEIQDFFENYKNLQNKKVIINGFKDKKWAIEVYHECVELMDNYKHLSKKDFIKKMMIERPEKYPK